VGIGIYPGEKFINLFFWPLP